MIALAGLIWLPLWAIALFGVVLVAGHNALVYFNPKTFTDLGPIWNVLHRPGIVLQTDRSVVLVSSAASRLGSPFEYVDYAGSKGAIDTLTIGLAKELAPQGVRVNAVRPGLIETDIHASGGQPDRAKRLGAATPMRRAGRPDEVAEAIVWLLSDSASYTTGALLDVAGGR